MNKGVLILALLQVGACTTSTTPGSGIDGGSRFDAAGFDAPRFDTPRFDAPRFDAGPVRRDAGPPRDSGPVVLDVGPLRDTGPVLDVGPIACMPEGTYGASPLPSNPPLCEMANLTSCTVTPGASSSTVRLSCAGVSFACAFTAGCLCTGSTVFAGIPIDATIDFDTGLATFLAAGAICEFTLMP